MTRDQIHVYEPHLMPNVEVQLEDGTWAAGEARMRWQDADTGVWWYQVQWRPPGTHTRKIDRYPADRLRPDERGGPTVGGPT